MLKGFRKEIALIVAWIVFPLLPVVLENVHYSISDFEFTAGSRAGPDPYEWSWGTWVVILGPLLGFGFLAGATMTLPDGVARPRRHLRNFFARRGVWVALGPWWGTIVFVGLYFAVAYLQKLFPSLAEVHPDLPSSWKGNWRETAATWGLLVMLVGVWSYVWLFTAWFALRRAARVGELKKHFVRGLMTAGAFLGSLFGGFWAATSVFRSYFFDSRIVKVLLVSMSLAIVSGCSGEITYGEMRRRELFHALLVSWILGLALMWRWWSRRRPSRTPDSSRDSSDPQ